MSDAARSAANVRSLLTSICGRVAKVAPALDALGLATPITTYRYRTVDFGADNRVERGFTPPAKAYQGTTFQGYGRFTISLSELSNVKLAILTPKFPPDPGGVAEASARISALLAATGHYQVTVLALRVDCHKPTSPTETSPGLWVQDLPLIPMALNGGAPQLIHAFYPSVTGPWALALQQQWHCPLAVAFRGNDLDRDLWRTESRETLLAVMAQAVGGTAVSRELARKAQTLAPQVPMMFIPNSVVRDRLTPTRTDLKAAWEIQPTLPVLGFSGEMRQKKGLPVLLQAWQALQPLYLVLLGGVRPGPDTDLLTLFMAQNPDLKSYLKMVPYQSQYHLADWYEMMDIMVCPSYQEGCPNSVLEAMACGRPVVATSVGGIPDVITHQVDGWLVPPRHTDALVKALRQLLAAPHLRQHLGQAAQHKIQTTFTPEREVRDYQDFYCQLIENPR